MTLRMVNIMDKVTCSIVIKKVMQVHGRMVNVMVKVTCSIVVKKYIMVIE